MDLLYALRSLRKNPGFTVLAVVVLALGIGANTAIFSVVNAVLLQPLPYKDPSRIMSVRTLQIKTGRTGSVSAPDFHDWHDQNSVFAAMAYYAAGWSAIRAGAEPERVMSAVVTAEFFQVFGVTPSAGRLFSGEETKKGGTVVVSEGFADRNFGGATQSLGKRVRMFDFDFTIIGVMPGGFHFPAECDLWSPANTLFPETTARSAHNYLVAGRLKPDVTIEQAQTQMTAISERIAQQYAENKNKRVAVIPMRDQLMRQIRPTLYLLLAAVGVLLLIACANVANLLLVRSAGRTREMAIRAAIGASRMRIVRQLTTESLVLGAIAGVAGVTAATWSLSALLSLAPANVPRLNETHVDWRVLLFAFALSMLTSVLFGLAPALAASKTDLNDALKQGGGRAVVSGAQRLRSLLVVSEIALSMVLLIGAGLLIKSFMALNKTDAGYRTENLLVMQTFAPSGDGDAAKRDVRLLARVLESAARIPGVRNVSAVDTLPNSIGSNGGYRLEGHPNPAPGDFATQQAAFAVIAPHYFKTLSIPMVRGRDFDERDGENGPITCIINEALVRESFAHEDPIGKRMQIGMDRIDQMTIVGVVRDIRQYGLDQPAGPEIFVPYWQHPTHATQMAVIVDTQSPNSATPALREQVRELSPDVPVRFTTMQKAVATYTASPRFRTLLLGALAGLAVVLAMIGLYGVMAFVVSQRSAEIGVRVALGAKYGDVLRLVLSQGLALTGMGLIIGLAGSFAATRLLANLLYGVKPTDPLTYVLVAVLLGCVAVLATFIPAHRATQVDPVRALRQE